MNGIALFAVVMKYLKTHFHQALEDRPEIVLEGMTVSYVITVPAKWDNASRECIKIAARKAGIAPVHIFSESEAAGRYCSLIPIRASPDDLFYLPRPNSRHAIVNLGGRKTEL